MDDVTFAIYKYVGNIHPGLTNFLPKWNENLPCGDIIKVAHNTCHRNFMNVYCLIVQQCNQRVFMYINMHLSNYTFECFYIHVVVDKYQNTKPCIRNKYIPVNSLIILYFIYNTCIPCSSEVYLRPLLPTFAKRKMVMSLDHSMYPGNA